MINMSQPIITKLEEPVDIIPIELIKEYIGLDDDIDAEQDRVLPVLKQASIEFGEQITGIVWAATKYEIKMMDVRYPSNGIRIPISPIFKINSVNANDLAGEAVEIREEDYHFVASAIEVGRPWAEIVPLESWSSDAVYLTVSCEVGWSEENLPESIRNWILTRVSTQFDIRTNYPVGTISPAVSRDHTRALLDRWTVRSGAHD